MDVCDRGMDVGNSGADVDDLGLCLCIIKLL